MRPGQLLDEETPMERTSWVPGIRAGAASLVAALALVCLPGTTIAGGSSAAAAEPSTAPSAPLTRGVGFDRPDGAAQVRALQRRLQELGQRPGPIDGLFGPLTEAAVERFQRTSHLVADGVVGSHTLGALAGAGHAGGGSPARPAGNARRPEQPTRAQAPPAGGTKARRPTTSRGLSRAAGRQRATRAHRRQPAGAREANHPLPWRLLAVLLLGLALVALLAALALGGVRRRVAAPRAEATVGGQEFRRQSKIITGECKRRGLRVLELVREHEPHSGKGLGRPGLRYAFKRISTGEAQGLVVSELSRLSRS